MLTNQVRIEMERTMTNVETALNVTGSIPLVSIVTGAIRVIIGKIQFIAAAIFALYAAVREHSSANLREKAEWAKQKNIAIEYMAHGALNVIVGSAEMLLLGSAALSIYRLARNDFTPQFKYSGWEHARKINLVPCGRQ